MHATYRGQGAREQPTLVAWASLGRDTHERLAAACRGEGALPLLVALPPGPRPAGFLAWALGLGGALAGLGGALALSLGQGSIDMQLDKPPGQLAVLWLSASGAICAALAARAAVLRGALPFPAGFYLFASELIEARGSALRLLPTSLLTEVTFDEGSPFGRRRSRGKVTLHFEGERHSFLADKETALALAQQLHQLRATLGQAIDADDLATVERLDPLWAERPRWEDHPPALAPDPARSRWISRLWSPGPLMLLAAAGGLLGGWGLTSSIARESDRAALQRASESSDPEALRVIALRPGPSSDEADARLLRRALGAPGWRPLLDYLRHGGRRRGEALEELFLRVADPGSPARDPDAYEAGLLAYLELCGRDAPPTPRDPDPARPAHEAEVDELLFRWIESGQSKALALDTYARMHLRRADEVRKLHIPRRALREAVRLGDVAALWNIQKNEAPEVSHEAQVTLRRWYDNERELLGGATGLRTPLLRQLDALLSYLATQEAPLQIVIADRIEGDLQEAFPEGPPRQRLNTLIREHLTGALVARVDGKLLRFSAPQRERLLIPAPSSPHLRLAYTMREVGAGVVTELQAQIHLPDRPDLEPARLVVKSNHPQRNGAWSFADDLGRALGEALGAPAAGASAKPRPLARGPR